VSKVNGMDIQYSIDNAYKDYKAHPSDLKSILQHYLAASAGVQDMDRDVKAENIVPIVKFHVFLDEVKIQEAQMGAKKPMDMVYDVYNRDLIVLYAFNNNATIQYMSAEELKKLGVPRDSLRSMAIRNMVSLLDSGELQKTGGVYIPVGFGNYVASLILLDRFWTKENLAVKGDIVISIPSRDILLITGSDDKEGMKNLRMLIEKASAETTYPVSSNLYRWDGKGFVPFE
jgi:uncharacterized protein YtpQ (UPF0354 family)